MIRTTWGRLPVAQTPPSMAVDACAKMVAAATDACQRAAATPPPAPSQDWDALANSFAALSVVLGWGGLLLGVIAVVAGFAWGKLVKRDAEREARDEAKACVRKLMDDWLDNEAPQIVRRHVELLQDTSIGNVDDDTAADDIGKGAG